ncbi:MAG TPA: RHS repeat-associated core domain-containing protein, partial [Chloroflexota bacterium]|nr:RHS repeat-associated core domain-containing protein [Chloroflexota bacterium]
MKYGWDAAGSLATIMYPDGNVITYTYDSQNRMITMNDGNGNATDFAYDSNGNLSTVTPPNGTVTTYTYNSNDQLDKVATTKSGLADFSFDASASGSITPSGNVQNVTTSQASALGLLPGASGSPGSDTYSYDPLSRLTNDAHTGTGNVTSTLNYADNGEIHQVTSGNIIDQATYAYGGTTGNDPGAVKSVGSGTVFDVNSNGNRTCQGTATPCSSHTTYSYTWDGADRLTNWVDGGVTNFYTYDGNGLLQKTVHQEPSGGSCPNIRRHQIRRHTLFCTIQDSLDWNTALGTPTLAVDHEYATGVDEGWVDYIMGPQGLPIEQLTNGTSTPEWFYADIQGNTRALANSSGTVGNTENYPPYGVATDSFGGIGLGTPLQYNGTYSDSWTGYVYDQSRWYDPSAGQFLSQDPLVDQTLQPYEYAGANPISNTDPTGTHSDGHLGKQVRHMKICDVFMSLADVNCDWWAELTIHIKWAKRQKVVTATATDYAYKTGTHYVSGWNSGVDGNAQPAKPKIDWMSADGPDC